MTQDDAGRTPDSRIDAGDTAGADGGARADAPRSDDTSAVEQLRAELESVKDRMLRERAELENFKKRTARERADSLRYASESLLRDLLPVIDNLERALEHAAPDRQSDPLVQGIELVLRQFTDALGRHGVKPIDALGASFDPARHQAIRHVESAEPANSVVGEHQRGYTLHDRLLRPSMVSVGKGPGAAAGDGAAPGRERVETNGSDD